jgi:hypothetical protein
MDGIKTIGRVQIEVYRLSFLWRNLVKFYSYLGLEDEAQKIMRFRGIKKDFALVNNTLTNTSRAVMSGLVGNTGAQVAFGYLALGTDATAPAASQTALIAETVVSGLARAAATIARITTTQTNDTLRFQKTFTAAGSANIQEVGFFNDPSVGVMGGRALTGSKNLISGDTLAITYTVQFT